jgi:Mitochondrial ATP synthase epsilon chain
MSAVTRFSSNFRLSGLNYLEMINIATTSMRKVLKEPLRSESLGAAKFHYREFVYEGGVEGTPSEVFTMFGAVST